MDSQAGGRAGPAASGTRYGGRSGDVERGDRRSIWQGFGDALAAAVEFVAVPILFGLLGLWLDGLLGTRPVLAIVLGLIGLVGVVARTYYWYVADMKREEEARPWTRSPR
jgi:F0F1-type ATP synthase assembly protein I